MQIFRFHVIAIGIAAVLILSPVIPASAERQADPAAPQGKAASPSAVEACNQFRNALKPSAPSGTQSPVDRAQQNLGGIAEAGKQGITCAQALARYFENLRKNGAKGTWSDIEREMDLVIDTYRSLLEQIEGTGGTYEEGQRAVTVLDGQIKEIIARRGEAHKNVTDARSVRNGIAAGLEQTKKLKSVLDNALVDIQARKSEIVEAEGIQRYSEAQKALEAMNEGLTKVIDELVKAIRKPGS